MASDPARVVLCDDHEIVRDAIKARLANSSSVEIVGEATDGWEVVNLVRELSPDVLVIDIEMPRRDGIAATREIAPVRPETKVIVFSAHAQPDLISLALRAGASGFVPKSAPAEDIARAVEAVIDGRTYLGGGIADDGPPAIEKLLDLPHSERKILELLADGLPADDVAELLSLSPAAVDERVHEATAELGVETDEDALGVVVRFSHLAGGSLKASRPAPQQAA